jgi:hypothetical protein
MLYTLVEYEDSTIVHTIPDVVELLYCNTSKTFRMTTLIDQKTLSYCDYDIEKASQALYRILNKYKTT